MEDLAKCSECDAEIQPGSKFCKECGKPVEDTPEKIEVPESMVKCPQCNAELKAEEKFCTECGVKIEPITNCPKCNAKIEPGTSFCTECGTNIYEYKPSAEPKPSSIQTGTKITDLPPSTSSSSSQSTQSSSNNDPLDNIIQDVEKTGRGLMKDLGGFLDKSSSKSSKKTIKPAKKDQKFLVCSKCGGYYELQTGESPEDFSLECDCGGQLEVKNQHP